jgi:hypothetical protein
VPRIGTFNRTGRLLSGKSSAHANLSATQGAQLGFLHTASDRLNDLLNIRAIAGACQEKQQREEDVPPVDVRELRKRLLNTTHYYLTMYRELCGDDVNRLVEILKDEKALTDEEIKLVIKDSGVPHENFWIQK